MAVKSNAFGRVILTGEDAKKFKNQVTYGKPKAAAIESLARGTSMAASFRENAREFRFKAKSR
jgi:hypothetical protein